MTSTGRRLTRVTNTLLTLDCLYGAAVLTSATPAVPHLTAATSIGWALLAATVSVYAARILTARTA